MIGVFNAGYTRKSAYVLRVVGDKNKRPKKFSCFAFIAIAGISSKNLSETLLDRSIVIELKRKSTAITKIKPRDLDQNRLLDIKRKLTRIAIDYKDKLQKHKIQTKIDGLNDRQLDNWSPLLKLVELSNDKKFIEQTVAAVQKLSKEHDNNYTESNKHKILRFIAMAMKKQKPQQDLLSAEQLASFVNNSLDISVDASLTARRISMCLSEYNIKSKQTVQNDGRNLRCYSIQEISSVINDYIAETELMAEVL